MKNNNLDPKGVEVKDKHQEWVLEKQTEGLNPEVISASEDLKKELVEEPAEG